MKVAELFVKCLENEGVGKIYGIPGEENIDMMDALSVAFEAAVFSRDIDTALGVSKKLDATAVMINDHTAFRVDWMPFAGLRQSGLGVGGIPHTMHDMQIDKMIVMRSNAL